MKGINLACIGLISLNIHLHALNVFHENEPVYITKLVDSLPLVLTKNHSDVIESKLKYEAFLKFEEHQLPNNIKDWEKSRSNLKSTIIKKAGIVIDHKLPLNYRETGSINMKGYTIKNIAFQTRPGVYATANLYIPEGKGPFPAVIHMHGHWKNAKTDEECVQPVGHSLALNGYVCLTIDAFGAGERSTIHEVSEYHGNNLGASLMNIGESLMGFQISDNIRAVDLLCSLPYVDVKNIGATGASGGGNQTMWLAAIDERIKAAVPVVSVGTFESYIMRSNCICELLIDGLTFTEEAGILALVAPKAIKMCNHYKDDIPTFLPAEMLRSYNNAQTVFKMLGVANNISYHLSDTTHGYWPEDRQAMLGWFDLHLKRLGNGDPKKEIPFKILPPEQLMVYAKGKRDPEVISISQYCKQKGEELRKTFLGVQSFNSVLKRKELRNILKVNEKSILKKVHEFSNADGWNRFALETSDGKLIPLLLYAPLIRSQGYVIICHPKGKSNIQMDLIDELKKKGTGIVIADLSGTGEAASPRADTLLDDGMPFSAMSRSELWLSKTVLGEWEKELNVVVQFLKDKYQAQKISLEGSKETGLAALFLGAVEEDVDTIILKDAPISYLFDSRETVDFFNMGIHLPGFLNWGDVSLVAALTGKNVIFINPLTMSGQKINENKLKEYQLEFERVRRNCKQAGQTIFKKD